MTMQNQLARIAGVRGNDLLDPAYYGPDGEGGNRGNTALGGASSGNRASSGANWGPTSQGYDGLSPGRNALGFAGQVAGMFAPSPIGTALSIGNAANGAARSAQLADAIGQMSGKPPSNNWGQAALGLFGMGTTDADYGRAAMEHNLTPDQSDAMLSNFIANANVNIPAGDLAGLGGAISSGISQNTTANPASLAAYGQPATGFSVGNDGVVSATGVNTDDGFGGVVGAGDTSSQGGAGANGAGGASGGGSGGGSGANGGGGDNAGGVKDGGVVTQGDGGDIDDRFMEASGLVRGPGGPRGDKIATKVPFGSFVIPEDVVRKLGSGNAVKGGEKLAALMHAAPGKQDHDDGRDPIPVHLSNHEFVAHPAHVAALGGPGGLDQLVAAVRRATR